MQDPSTKQTEREAYSEFVAALDTARSSFTDRLKAADDLFAEQVRAGELLPNVRGLRMQALDEYAYARRVAAAEYVFTTKGGP